MARKTGLQSSSGPGTLIELQVRGLVSGIQIVFRSLHVRVDVRQQILRLQTPSSRCRLFIVSDASKLRYSVIRFSDRSVPIA